MNLTVSTNPSCIKDLESTYFNSNVPKIKVGDSVKIGVSIAEGNKERIQFSEGVVIAKSNAGLNTTITTRRVMQGIGIERLFLIHSPKIASIEIKKSANVKRSKLYYLRNRSGKATRLKQKY